MGIKASKQTVPGPAVQKNVNGLARPEQEPPNDIQPDNSNEYDIDPVQQEDFFRALTNTDFCNVPPPNTSFKDDETISETDQSANKENGIPITIVEEEAPEPEEIPPNLDAEEEVFTEQEYDEAVEEDNVEEEISDDMEEQSKEIENANEEKEMMEETKEEEVTEELSVENPEDLSPEENTGVQEPLVDEAPDKLEEEQIEEEPQPEEKLVEEEPVLVEQPIEKRKPRNALEAVFDAPSVDESMLPVSKPSQVETVPYVEEDDEDEDKFDITLSEAMSAYFAKSYDPMIFDFSLASANLKPIREFVTKWGFYKSVPTPDVLQRAQKAVRHFNVAAPRTERGYLLPFPVFLTNPPDMKSFQTIESTLKLKETKSFEAFIKLIKDMNSVVDDAELKIRIIMKWMSQHSHKIPPLGKSEKSDFAGYAQVHLFYKFCKMVDIECAVIEGRRKLYHREPSTNPGKRAVKAVWCAVLVKGHWRFVDPSLPGLKELKKMNDQKMEPESENVWFKTMRSKIGEYYSLPDPTLFVHTHLPDVEYWQLLCRPVMESEWYNMVCVSPMFFHCGFDLQSKVTYNVKCNGGHLIMTFTYPADKMFVFNSSIVPNPPKNPPYICIESDFDGKSLSVEVFVRQKGTYFLHIYFKDLGSDCPDFLFLCTYCLEVSKPNLDAFDACFVNVRQHWGPADDTLDAGLIPVTHVTSEIDCYKDFLDIVFDLQNDMNFHCSLIDKDGRDLSRHVVHWIYGKKLNIKITCPGFQKCVLEICIKNETDGTKRTICNYRIQFNSSYKEMKSVMGFPPSMTKLGVTDAGELLKFVPLFPNPCAITMSEETTLKFSVEPSDTIIFPSLKYVADKLYNTDSYMAWYLEDGKLTVSINPLRYGLYLLIMQSKYNINMVENTMLYFGLIKVDIPSSQWSPYPERSVDTQRQIKIVEPKTQHLCAKQEYTFSYEIEGNAQDVAIVTSNGWSHLEHQTPNIWEGTSMTGPKGTDVTLNARFDVGSQKFTKLLTYRAIDPKEYEGRNKRQEQIRTTKMLAFAQDDEKAKPTEKLSKMAEKHRKDVKSKGKSIKESDTSKEKKLNQTATQKEGSATVGKGSNTPRATLTKRGSMNSITEEPTVRGIYRKRGSLHNKEDSGTPRTTRDTRRDVKREQRSYEKPLDKQTRGSNSTDDVQKDTPRRGSKSNPKDFEKQDEKVRKGSNGSMKDKSRKSSTDQPEPLRKDSITTEVNHSNQRPTSEKSVQGRTSSMSSDKESIKQNGTNSKNSVEVFDDIEENEKDLPNDTGEKAKTPRKSSTQNDPKGRPSYEKMTKASGAKSEIQPTDTSEPETLSPATIVRLKAKRNNQSNRKGEKIEIQPTDTSEPETLSPTTIVTLKAKRNNQTKRKGEKIAFANPAGMLASPRINVS